MKKFLAAIIALPFWMDGCARDVAGTTEETNALAFWDEDKNLQHWDVIDGGNIALDAKDRQVLAGRVVLGKPSADGLARAGIEYDVSDKDGNPSDLSDQSEGLCIAYESDFDVDVQLDMGDFVNASLDEDLPHVSMHSTSHGVETHCHRWSNFRQDHSDGVVGAVAAMTVRSVRMVFKGMSGENGNFRIERVGKYEDGSDFLNQ